MYFSDSSRSRSRRNTKPAQAPLRRPSPTIPLGNRCNGAPDARAQMLFDVAMSGDAAAESAASDLWSEAGVVLRAHE